jgi:hypothetical protein
MRFPAVPVNNGLNSKQAAFGEGHDLVAGDDEMVRGA